MICIVVRAKIVLVHLVPLILYGIDVVIMFSMAVGVIVYEPL